MSREPDIAALERDLPAYARSLGIVIEAMEDGSPVLAIPFGEIVEGGPTVSTAGRPAACWKTPAMPPCAPSWPARGANTG